MLNKDWKNRIDTDAHLVNRIKNKFYSKKNVFIGSIDDIYPEDKGVINYLISRFYVTEKGGNPSLNQNLYAKLSMLGKIFNELDFARAEDAKEWEARQELEMDPIDKIIRDDEMRKSREEFSSLSTRDRIALASNDGLVDMGRFWITKSGQVLPVDPSIHHAEWIMDHKELLNQREQKMVERFKNFPKDFTDMLFGDEWVRVSGNVAQMYSEFSMPKFSEFLKTRDGLNENGEITIIFTKDEQEKVMVIKDIISRYGSNLDDGFELVASSIGGKGSKKPDSDFDPKQLAKGEKHEADEHNLSEEDAKKVTKDHLLEIPDYYDKIQEMEKKLKSSASPYFMRVSSRDNAIEDIIKYTKKYIKPKSKDNKAAEEMVEYTKKYKGR